MMDNGICHTHVPILVLLSVIEEAEFRSSIVTTCAKVHMR